MPRAVLIYDGDCRFCRGGKDWIERNAVEGAFEFLPCQSDERKSRFPRVSEETCMGAMQLALPDGKVLTGDRAIPEILRRLKRWRWLSVLFKIPGVHFFAPHIYGWVAQNRYRISCVLPERS